MFIKIVLLLDYLTEELEFDIDNNNINDRKSNNNGKYNWIFLIKFMN